MNKMDGYTKKIKKLLKELRDGKVTVGEVMEELRDLPFEDLTHSKLDHHRALRKGFPEVVYCAGKTNEQLADIARALKAQGHN
ncbi:MAG: 1-(5-phosphoribosyl)-5-amino-4-imidazole-carboxylate carboxylase, partial [bacterium]